MIKTHGEWLALLGTCDGLILITNLMGFRITIKQISTPQVYNKVDIHQLSASNHLKHQ